jgi:hypothetical protein
MITVFFGVGGMIFLNILPSDQKVIFEYFQANIIRVLAVEQYPISRKIGTPRYILHFNNGSIHNTEKIEEALVDYSPD